MKIRCLLLSVTLVACGGGASKSTTTPIANPDPVPMTERSQEVTPPTEPGPTQPDPAKVKAALLAAETAAYDKARPVFEANCARCHTRNGRLANDKKRDHFDMTTYPFGGHHAMELGTEIRKVLGIDGSKPTMPADNRGVIKGEELALIATWADAFDASHAGGAHEHHDAHAH